MSVFRILVDTLPPAGTSLDVPAEQAHHLIHVRRIKVGTEIVCIDRQGLRIKGKVSDIYASKVNINLLEELPSQIALAKITILPALIPEKRFDWLLQKCTELGVAECYPVLSTFCKVKVKDAAKKIIRWQRICDDAARQCGGNPMQVHAPLTINEACLRQDSIKIIADQHGISINNVKKANNMSLLIGPEGGFSKNEIDQAIELGWQAVSFHPNILRAETAAIVCSTLLMF